MQPSTKHREVRRMKYLICNRSMNRYRPIIILKQTIIRSGEAFKDMKEHLRPLIQIDMIFPSMYMCSTMYFYAVTSNEDLVRNFKYGKDLLTVHYCRRWQTSARRYWLKANFRTLSAQGITKCRRLRDPGHGKDNLQMPIWY